MSNDNLMDLIETTDDKIKVYKDAYADANYAKVGFKGKTINETGIIFCPYKKPSIIRRFINWIINKFRSNKQSTELLDKTKL